MQNETQTIGYPIKYTILPIGLKTINKAQAKTDAYIAIECKLLEETIKYYERTNPQTEYKIILKRNPQTAVNGLSTYDTDFDECYNVVKTSQLFDTYEEAKKYARTKNKDIYINCIKDMPLEEIDNFLEETNKNFKEAYKIEEQLLSEKPKIKKLGTIK